MTARRASGTSRSHGRERRRVEQVARVEQRGQQDDPGPRQAARHVADGRELRGPGEDDGAHRHRLDRREAGLARGQAVDEPEADRRDRDPEASVAELAPAGRDVGVGGRRSAQERLAAGPVADDVDGVLLGGVAGHVEQARAARRRALPDPPALVVVERRRLRRRACAARSLRAATSAAIRRPARPRSRSCTGSSGRCSSSRARVIAVGPVAASCERCRHRTG